MESLATKPPEGTRRRREFDSLHVHTDADLPAPCVYEVPVVTAITSSPSCGVGGD